MDIVVVYEVVILKVEADGGGIIVQIVMGWCNNECYKWQQQ